MDLPLEKTPATRRWWGRPPSRPPTANQRATRQNILDSPATHADAQERVPAKPLGNQRFKGYNERLEKNNPSYANCKLKDMKLRFFHIFPLGIFLASALCTMNRTTKKSTISQHRFPAQREIARLAEQFYLDTNCETGHDVDNWLYAEYVLKNKTEFRLGLQQVC